MDPRRFQFLSDPKTGLIQMVELNRLGCMRVEGLLRNGWNKLFQMEANDT
jgi:hypothetical protein